MFTSSATRGVTTRVNTRSLILRRLLAASLAAGFLLSAPSARAQTATDPAPAPSPTPGTPESQSPTPPTTDSAPAPAAEVPPPPPGAEEKLSDERKRSQWAYVGTTVLAREAPDPTAKPLKRLTATVPDTESPELVLLLSQRTLADGAVWVEVRLPMRPNNRTGWVPRHSLGSFRTVTKRLVIDRRGFQASLYDERGRRVWTAPIGIGGRRWPTPQGRFYIRERLVIPRGRLRKVYGPFAFGTSAHSATLSGGNWGEWVVGIHGTGSPKLVPGRISHGCVRVRNASIQRLRRLMPLGTPVQVR